MTRPDTDDAVVRNSPANAIGEERILDAAYELMLAIGMRRMTMADIGRRARVSRATLYRRWPNVQAVVAALVTREWSTIATASFQVAAESAASFQVAADSQVATGSAEERGSARHLLVEGIVSATRRSREHPLLRTIVNLDPEFLLPYLLQRRGSSADEQLELIETGLRAGHADGSIRPGDAAWQARALLLTALSFTLSGPIMAAPEEYPRLDDELRTLLDRYVSPDGHRNRGQPS
ncbi:MAG: helix-turn-helix domain-containing protein [Micromonosporaceae bacterium]